MDANQPISYRDHCNQTAMKLYEAVALINAIGAMAEHHADSEASPQAVLTDIELITRNVRRIMYSVTDDLDRNSTKYQLIG